MVVFELASRGRRKTVKKLQIANFDQYDSSSLMPHVLSLWPDEAVRNGIFKRASSKNSGNLFGFKCGGSTIEAVLIKHPKLLDHKLIMS